MIKQCEMYGSPFLPVKETETVGKKLVSHEKVFHNYDLRAYHYDHTAKTEM